MWPISWLTFSYPSGLPIIRVTSKIPHPLIDSDDVLHIDVLLHHTASRSMASVLACIATAFTEQSMRSLRVEDCINIATKLQYVIEIPRRQI